MLCFRCGEDNPPLSNFCSKCNAKLPKFASNVSPPIDAPKTERLMKILGIGNKMLDMITPPEKILEEVELQEKSIQKAKDKLKFTPMHKATRKEFQPQIDMGINGMSLFLKSLEEFKNILTIINEDNNEENIDENIDETDEDDDKIYYTLSEEQQDMIKQAMETAKEGNEFLNKCYEMSKESMRKVREENIMYEDESNIL